MGLALHEMWQISELLIGDIPYEEYFPESKELEILSTRDNSLYHTLRGLTCHYCVCSDLSDAKEGVIWHKK